MKTSLRVQVYDSSGRLKATRYMPDDLMTDNFRKWLIGVWDTSATSCSLSDTGGNARTITTKCTTNSAWVNTYCDSYTGTDLKGGYMSIGSGTNAPTQSDVELQTIYGSAQAVSGTYPTWDVTSGNVTIQSTFSITGTVTITESGLYVSWLPSSGSTCYKFLMARDTYTGISCSAGDTVVNALIINLSVSFNRNVGIFLSGIFKYVGDNVNNQLVMYNTAGGSINVLVYDGTSGVSNQPITYVTGNKAGISQGTGTTAEGRTTNTLTTLVDSEALITYDSISGSTIVIKADVLCGSARALREDCLIYHAYIGEMMFIRKLYDEVDIAQAHNARHTYTISV